MNKFDIDFTDLVYVVIWSLALYTLLVSDIFGKYLSDLGIFGIDYIFTTIGGYLSTFLRWIDGYNITTSVVSLLLWATIGLVMHAILSISIHSLDEVRQQWKLAIFYVHPDKFSTAGYILHGLMQFVLSMVFTVVMAAWVIFGFNILFKFAHDLTYVALFDHTTLLLAGSNLLAAFASIVLFVTGIFLGYKIIIRAKS